MNNKISKMFRPQISSVISYKTKDVRCANGLPQLVRAGRKAYHRNTHMYVQLFSKSTERCDRTWATTKVQSITLTYSEQGHLTQHHTTLPVYTDAYTNTHAHTHTFSVLLVCWGRREGPRPMSGNCLSSQGLISFQWLGI